MNVNVTKGTVLVWDLPIRIGHWIMAIAFLVAWLTGESEEWRLVHVVAGGAILGVVSFRTFWGLFGTRYALFADFIRSPAKAIRYLRRLITRTPENYIGHNPAGGWAILLLLVLALITCGVGWLAYQDIGGEWLKEFHEGAATAMLVVVIIHLGGVAVGSIAHGENLPRSMITGRKRGASVNDIGGSRPLAAFMLVAWVALLAWLVSR
jgi:cytochrome b